jgi:ketosteroid isomerase-like protein
MTTSHDAPTQVIETFLAAFNAGDAAALEFAYERDAVLVPRPGIAVTGPDRAAANEYLLKLGSPMQAKLRHAYVVDDIALLIVDWSIPGTEISGTATDVARRGEDGVWRYVIDNPNGTA